MSTPERADDPGDHGYGGANEEFPEQDVPGDSDEDEVEHDDDRRHVGGGGLGEGDGVDYPVR